MPDESQKKKKKKKKKGKPKGKKDEKLKKLKLDLTSKKTPANPVPEIPELPVTDEAHRFLRVLESVYSAAHGSSYAAAVMEVKMLASQLKDVDDEEEEGSEVENRFDKSRFIQLYDKLIELKSIKELAPAFGLDTDTVNQILQVRIQALFGSGNASSSGKKGFYGNDEQFLKHVAKQKIIAQSGRE
jgi:hypothetical protein